MTELAALEAACRAAPDDDAPRLVWADAVGGERGEFVVLQCQLAREELSPAARGALIRRHDELLAAHGIAWSGFEDCRAARSCSFRRGFVEAVALDVRRAPWTTIFERAPLVRSLRVRGIAKTFDHQDDADAPESGVDPVEAVTELLADPALAQLAGLELDDTMRYDITGDTEWHHHSQSRADDVLEAIAPRLPALRAFSVQRETTPRGIAALLDSPVLGSLEQLGLHLAKPTPEQTRALFGKLPRLRALDLLYSDIDPQTFAALPASVVELQLPFGDATLAALAASPIAPTLERLHLSGASQPRDLAPLSAFPRLRALDLTGVTPDSVVTLARLSLPALRELCLLDTIDAAYALELARALGGQLACLDVIGQKDQAWPEDVRAAIAGHVRTGPYRNRDTLLDTATNTRAPWLRYGFVELYWWG
ncbi:MAG TPA: hypothetical protein VFQ53_36995 [Kofleriaceae bacterium]|nr:hypothetical protein [Kofleriaceae bacterium]